MSTHDPVVSFADLHQQAAVTSVKHRLERLDEAVNRANEDRRSTRL